MEGQRWPGATGFETTQNSQLRNTAECSMQDRVLKDRKVLVLAGSHGDEHWLNVQHQPLEVD